MIAIWIAVGAYLVFLGYLAWLLWRDRPGPLVESDFIRPTDPDGPPDYLGLQATYVPEEWSRERR
jgi:hypothetical protein